MSQDSASPQTMLEYISTHWRSVEDPAQFVLRYAPAIRGYIDCLLKGSQDAEDVAQDFLASVMGRQFSAEQINRGRFRDFLRASVRNAVIDHLRAKKHVSVDPQLLENTLAAAGDHQWLDSWRSCLLDAALLRLRQFQRDTPDNLYHTVLRLTLDFPDDDSPSLARRLSQATGREVRSDAYRQQLHRARRKFAELLVGLVGETLREADEERLAEELCELGLKGYVELT